MTGDGPHPNVTDERDIQIETVLVPVDASDAAGEAVEHAGAVADRYDAELHALYVLGSGEVSNRRIEEIDKSSIAEDTQRVLRGIRASCESRSIPVSSSMALGFSTGRLTQHPGSVVLDCAEAVGADFVVVPRENDTDEPGMLAKAAGYVLSYASQPVLSV
jgi:nucleotide-binding universal stress UspA family protein